MTQASHNFFYSYGAFGWDFIYTYAHMWLSEQKSATYTLHWEKLAAVWIEPHLFTINILTTALAFIRITSKIHVAYFS